VIGGGIGCFLLLSLLAMAGERGFFEVYQFNRHLRHVESRIQALEVENERMRLQVIGLRSDPYQIEKLAREDLGLVRPDEIIFEIVDGHPENSSWSGAQRKE
jgi:cell division protein FtsB